MTPKNGCMYEINFAFVLASRLLGKDHAGDKNANSSTES